MIGAKRGMMKTTLEVDGMTCAACVKRVEEALRAVDGVGEVRVDLASGTASVEHADATGVERLIGAVDGMDKYAARRAEAGAGARSASSEDDSAADDADDESLYPLILVVSFLAGTVLLIELASGSFDGMRAARHFMAGFFLVFSFFKLLDPAGFVDTYRGYDLLAKALPAWAWAYPFVELLLGVAYLLDLEPVAVNAVTVVLMLVGAAGVLRALLARQSIRCGCLGTALNLPMTTVTLVEDLTMAAMAAVMLWMHLA